MTRTLAIVFGFVTLISTATVGCGFEDSECVAGQACVCQGAGACRKTCVGGGCDFETGALAAGAAEFLCEDGGCTLDADGMGAIELRCEGGSCQAISRGDGAMELRCPGNNCELTC